MRSTLKSYLVFVCMIPIVFLLYWPGLGGDFLHDDYVNIVENSNVHTVHLSMDALKHSFISVNTGVYSFLSRPVSMFTFSVNHYLTGLDPYWF